MTARAVARGNRPRETFTGAPHTRLVVKTPAADDGRSATNRAKSGFDGSVLIPQATPAARKPTGNAMDVAKSQTPQADRKGRLNARWNQRGKPKVSGKPFMRLKFCTATPEAPLIRLSVTEMTISRPCV